MWIILGSNQIYTSLSNLVHKWQFNNHANWKSGGHQKWVYCMLVWIGIEDGHPMKQSVCVHVWMGNRKWPPNGHSSFHWGVALSTLKLLHSSNVPYLQFNFARIAICLEVAPSAWASKGAFTLGVRDSSVESPNTMLVILDLHLLALNILC